MEDVLDLYAEPYDARRPVVNFDEKSKQLVAEKRIPIPAEPGRVERYDYEYRRNGVANLFAFCEARAGWRHFNVTEQRTKQDDRRPHAAAEIIRHVAADRGARVEHHRALTFGSPSQLGQDLGHNGGVGHPRHVVQSHAVAGEQSGRHLG